jgi:glycerophosphoryl diester phosphodiesterase
MLNTHMREIFKRQIAGRHVPLVMAHRGGLSHGRENSSLAIINSLRFNPDILEIDVKKSTDQVLFCYHGNNVWGILLFIIVGFLPFKIIRNLIKDVETLEQILNTTENTNKSIIVYLDIKSPSISSQDLNNVLNRFHLEKVWIAAYTFRKLARLREELGEKYVYVFNRPAIFFRRALKKCLGVADVIQLFPYQWKERNIDAARKQGIEVSLFKGFLPRYEKFKLAAKYKSLWFAYEDLTSIMYYSSEKSEAQE